MKKQIFLILINIIVLSIFIAIAPSMVAQQQNGSNYSTINESNYYPTMNESNYYPQVQDSKDEIASQTNESKNSTISSAVSSAEELIGEKSHESISLKDEKVTAVETTNKKINIEPILKRILESGYNPSSGVIRIADRKEQYKVPPDINNDTLLVKIYVSNKPTEKLYSELKISGVELIKYYPTEKLIKARVQTTNIAKIALLPEVTDVRRIINFPLTSEDYNIRFENNEQYYHVFLSVENHTSNPTIIETLEKLGIKIKKQYN